MVPHLCRPRRLTPQLCPLLSPLTFSIWVPTPLVAASLTFSIWVPTPLVAALSPSEYQFESHSWQARTLKPGGVLCIYGPFLIDGKPTTDSNAA